MLTLASIATTYAGGLSSGFDVDLAHVSGRRGSVTPAYAKSEQTQGISRQGALRAALLVREEEMQRRARHLREAGGGVPARVLVEKMYPPYPPEYEESRQRLMQGTQLAKQDERLMTYVNAEGSSDRTAGLGVGNDLQALSLGARVARDLSGLRPTGLARHSALMAGIGLEGLAP